MMGDGCVVCFSGAIYKFLYWGVGLLRDGRQDMVFVVRCHKLVFIG